MREIIVATMWHRPRIVGAVGETPPTQAELDEIARQWTAPNCGVVPAVRVLEDATPPRYQDSGEPTCEEIADWWGAA